jgi:ankyrin repeat protein
MPDGSLLTPIHVAAQEGHKNVVELFLNNVILGGRQEVINATDKNKRTALHLAAWAGTCFSLVNNNN